MSTKLIYGLLNGIAWYLMLELMLQVLDQLPRGGRRTHLLYTLGAWGVNSLCQLVWAMPLLNLADTLALLTGFALLCPASGPRRLRAVLTVLLAALLSDTVFFALSSGLLTNLFTVLVLLLINWLVERLTVPGGGEACPVGGPDWAAVLLIPGGTILVMVLLTQFGRGPDWLVAVLGLILVSINLLTFYLYRQVERGSRARYQLQILEQQNRAYANQARLYQEGERRLRTLRHDLRNHLAAVRLLDGSPELERYLTGFVRQMEPPAFWADSGNPQLDSLLNYKLCEARQAGAEVYTDIRLPAGLTLPLFTVNTILGNLLDNAVEGLSTCPDKRLSLALWADRGVCHLRVENTFDGVVRRHASGALGSRKGNDLLHGLGLESVRRALESLDGQLRLHPGADGRFVAEAVWYLPHREEATEFAAEATDLDAVVDTRPEAKV